MSRTTPRPRRRLLLEALENRVVPTADLVLQWNDVMRETVRATATPATFASRIMAITHGAIYDAVNALARTHEPFLVDALAHPRASREAAVAAAAHRALVALFPTRVAELDAKLAESLGPIPDGKAEDDGVALGRSVADQILALRLNDGSVNTLPPYFGGTAPGQWRPTPAAFASGRDPHWGGVTPFAIESADQFEPVAPPALDSAEYLAAFEQVKELGSTTSTTRTDDQRDMALFWNNGANTATPVGHLNLLARIVAEQEGTTLEENARLFAAMNIAMADALITCFDIKYEHSFWRPVTAVRETPGNETWTPLIATPAHPAYISGHSSNSGAAAAVLIGFFGTDDISFTLPSQNTALASRFYTSFSQAAEESAVSRLYGGIHWSFDNNVGLEVGNDVGQYVMANFLRPVDREAVAGVVNGELIVIGTDGGDVVSVVRAGNQLLVRANGQTLGAFAVTIAALVVDARDGNDIVLVSNGVRTEAEIYGGAGNDILSGGKGDDRIYGEAGHDILLGNQGDDHLDGGDGNDILFGGQGDDVLIGGLGDDWLFGGPGNDYLLP